MEELGIEPSRVVTTHNADAANLMRDGQLIAGAGFSSVPNPTADEMASTVGAKIIGVPHDIGAPIAEKFGLGLSVIRGGTYAGQPDDVETISQWSAVIANKDLPEDFVYEVTKLTFESNERMQKVHRSGAETTLENVKYLTGVPFHVGAIRYFEEQGVEIPESAYPPEYRTK
jgi:TRAP transporter TAXI family solute receptor